MWGTFTVKEYAEPVSPRESQGRPGGSPRGSWQADSSRHAVFSRNELSVAKDPPKKTVNFGRVVILNGGSPRGDGDKDFNYGEEADGTPLERAGTGISPSRRAASIYTTAGAKLFKKKGKHGGVASRVYDAKPKLDVDPPPAAALSAAVARESRPAGGAIASPNVKTSKASSPRPAEPADPMAAHTDKLAQEAAKMRRDAMAERARLRQLENDFTAASSDFPHTMKPSARDVSKANSYVSSPSPVRKPVAVVAKPKDDHVERRAPSKTPAGGDAPEPSALPAPPSAPEGKPVRPPTSDGHQPPPPPPRPRGPPPPSRPSSDMPAAPETPFAPPASLSAAAQPVVETTATSANVGIGSKPEKRPSVGASAPANASTPRKPSGAPAPSSTPATASPARQPTKPVETSPNKSKDSGGRALAARSGRAVPKLQLPSPQAESKKAPPVKPQQGWLTVSSLLDVDVPMPPEDDDGLGSPAAGDTSAFGVETFPAGNTTWHAGSGKAAPNSTLPAPATHRRTASQDVSSRLAALAAPRGPPPPKPEPPIAVSRRPVKPSSDSPARSPAQPSPLQSRPRKSSTSSGGSGDAAPPSVGADSTTPRRPLATVHEASVTPASPAQPPSASKPAITSPIARMSSTIKSTNSASSRGGSVPARKNSGPQPQQPQQQTYRRPSVVRKSLFCADSVAATLSVHSLEDRVGNIAFTYDCDVERRRAERKGETFLLSPKSSSNGFESATADNTTTVSGAGTSLVSDDMSAVNSHRSGSYRRRRHRKHRHRRHSRSSSRSSGANKGEGEGGEGRRRRRRHRHRHRSSDVQSTEAGTSLQSTPIVTTALSTPFVEPSAMSLPAPAPAPVPVARPAPAPASVTATSAVAVPRHPIVAVMATSSPRNMSPTATDLRTGHSSGHASSVFDWSAPVPTSDNEAREVDDDDGLMSVLSEGDHHHHHAPAHGMASAAASVVEELDTLDDLYEFEFA